MIIYDGAVRRWMISSQFTGSNRGPREIEMRDSVVCWIVILLLATPAFFSDVSVANPSRLPPFLRARYGSQCVTCIGSG